MGFKRRLRCNCNCVVGHRGIDLQRVDVLHRLEVPSCVDVLQRVDFLHRLDVPSCVDVLQRVEV